MEGVENPESNSVAGTGSSDVATNGIPFWLTVDLKTVKTLTGIQTRHWGAGYAPTKVEIFTSEDGENGYPSVNGLQREELRLSHLKKVSKHAI